MPTAPASDLSDELGRARAALQRGEMEHAARHAANALGLEPAHDEARALLTRAGQAAGPALLGQETHAATVAGHAWVLAQHGRLDRAVDLIVQVQTRFPGFRYESWTTEWLTRGAAISPERIGSLLAALATPTIGRMNLRRSERAMLERFLPMVRALPLAVREHPLGRIWRSSFFRRIGLVTEAQDEVREPVEGASAALELHRLTMLGLARRAGGRTDAAIEIFERAHALDGGPEYLLECARAAWDARRWREASSWLRRHFDQAGVEPDSEVASMDDHLHGGPIRELLGEDASIDDIVRLAGHGATPPEIQDASINLARQLGKDTLRQVALSHIESPSAWLAFAGARGLVYRFDTIPEPDPRQPHGRPEHVAWRLGRSSRGLPLRIPSAPSARVYALVEAIASTPAWLPRWWHLAAEAAERLVESDAEELLGAMVHPGEPRGGTTPWDWLQRLQIAAAFLLARMPPERGRRVLHDLLDGPIDWTTDAAILALTELALDEPERVDAIAAHLVALLDRLPDSGYFSTFAAAAGSCLRLPAQPADVRDRCEQMLRD